MRRIVQFMAAFMAASVVTACSDTDQVTDTGYAPTGGVRFINAVPDTGGAGGLDFRFVDRVENSSSYGQVFRNTFTTGENPASTGIQYKPTGAGPQRHFRIFLDDPDPAVAQTVLKDSTLNVEDGHRYTMLLWGNARGGATPMKLSVIDETCDPGQQVGLRVINATNTAVDVRQYLATSVKVGSAAATITGDLPADPTWANVAPMSVSSCISLPTTANTTVVGTTTTIVTYRFNVQPAGGGAPLFAEASALIGQANGTTANGCFVGIDCDATPGTSAAGSVVTAIIFPASVAGSSAAQFASPGISFVWDKRANRMPGT